MPIYEYQCASCGKKTEFIQSFSDPHPLKCPVCGGALKKLLSSPTAHFKGSGFYATDYGKMGGKDGESSSKERDGESSSNVKKEEGGGAKSDGGAESQGDSAGDSSKEKKDSKDSSKEKRDSGPGAASDGAAAKTSTAPDTPSKKNTRTK